MVLPETEILTSIIARVFRVEEVTLGDPNPRPAPRPVASRPGTGTATPRPKPGSPPPAGSCATAAS